jgi:hypothetical protein
MKPCTPSPENGNKKKKQIFVDALMSNMMMRDLPVSRNQPLKLAAK